MKYIIEKRNLKKHYINENYVPQGEQNYCIIKSVNPLGTANKLLQSGHFISDTDPIVVSTNIGASLLEAKKQEILKEAEQLEFEKEKLRLEIEEFNKQKTTEVKKKGRPSNQTKEDIYE